MQTVAVSGAPIAITVDGVVQDMYAPISVPAGAELRLGSIAKRGLRSYLAIRGGIDVADYLGSASTFTLGGLAAWPDGLWSAAIFSHRQSRIKRSQGDSQGGATAPGQGLDHRRHPRPPRRA